jgi:protein tyrosine phosphatase (PTP) superfamily phosphohydrolase (DUF442 family)
MNKLENIENYKKNSDKLSTSGQPTKEEIQLIADEGFEVLINTRPQFEMDEVFNEKAIAENLGIKYFQIETELNNPNMDELIRFLEIMTKFKENKILLHCHRNKRASALLAIYRVNKLGWSKEDALKKVEEAWEITPDLQSFIDVQISYLESK